MAFALSTIENAFYAWAYATGVTTTLWRYQNGPAPSLPYMTLNLNNVTKVNWDYQTQTDEFGNAALMGNREVTLEINYYGVGAMEAFEKLTTSLQSFPVIETFAASGLHYVDKLSQFNLTELVDSTNGYEERYFMELKFRYSNQGITAPGVFSTNIIQTTEVSGETTYGEDEIDTELEIGEPYTPPP